MFSDAYEDTKESKKSRRQICSNLFEHLFTQSTTELGSTALEASVPTTNPVISLPSLTSSTSDSPKPVPVKKSIVPPAAPKFEYASIESFDQVEWRRIHFLWCNSSLFRSIKNVHRWTFSRPSLTIRIPMMKTPTTSRRNHPNRTIRPVSLFWILQKQKRPHMSCHPNNGSQSLIVIAIQKRALIQASKKLKFLVRYFSRTRRKHIDCLVFTSTIGKSSSVYGPAAPRSLPSRSKTDSDSSSNDWLKNDLSNSFYSSSVGQIGQYQCSVRRIEAEEEAQEEEEETS